MIYGFLYPIEGLIQLPFFWSDALRNYFYYTWIYVLLALVYALPMITVLATFGLLFLIPPFVLVAIFQVNTWTLVIMRHALLKNQTWLARKIDETYKREILSLPIVRADFEEGRLSGWQPVLLVCKFFAVLVLSVFPYVPQAFMIPSIGWQYPNAIFLPNDRPNEVFWNGQYAYLGFGLTASFLEAIPFFSGLAFTSNYLGGTLMSLDMNNSVEN